MHPIVVIGASEGGLKTLLHIFAALPASCAASVFVVMHIGSSPSILPSLLGHAGRTVKFPQDSTLIEAGHVYVAPPGQHMLLGPAFVRLSRGPKVHYTRPAIDPLFLSAAKAYGKRVIGIVLSGNGSDGAAGLKAIKEHGGTALVQHPEGAETPSMPHAALTEDHPEALPIQEIAQRVASFCNSNMLYRPMLGP